MQQLLFILIALFTLSSAQADKPNECLMDHSMAGMTQDPVMCMAFMPTWTYDAKNNKCVKFTFGGCGGNPNQFTSKEKCEAVCKD